MFTFTLVDLEYETSVSLWEFEMTIVLKWHFCLHFSSLHDYIKKKMKLSLLMKSDTLILWILVFPVGIIKDTSSRKCCFWLHFISLHDYSTPSTWSPLVHISWGKMERCEIRVFHLLKMRKKNQLEHKYQVRNWLFIDS